MKEQHENEQQEKTAQHKQKRKSKMNKEKRFYLLTAIGSAAAIAAIIVVAAVANNLRAPDNQGSVPPVVDSNTPVIGGDEVGGNEDDEPVTGLPDGMILPVSGSTLVNEHGFYYNKTLDAYYEHCGVDFGATAGAEVLAVDDGVVESIYKEDLLLGTEIVVAHGNGLKSVYRFVTETEGLTVGAEVKKGDVIATVAEATGNEYKDGAHLHFEIQKDGKSVDPAAYLTMEEK